MQSLTDVYNHVASKDAELEKQAAELIKEAEEQDAAGRIMARGFADELAKLAGGYEPGNEFSGGPKGGAFKPQGLGTAKSGPVQTSGKSGAGYDPFKGRAPYAASDAAHQAGNMAPKPAPAQPKPAAGPAAAAPKPPMGAKPPAVAVR
jgi:hypothetical protein